MEFILQKNDPSEGKSDVLYIGENVAAQYWMPIVKKLQKDILEPLEFLKVKRELKVSLDAKLENFKSGEINAMDVMQDLYESLKDNDEAKCKFKSEIDKIPKYEMCDDNLSKSQQSTAKC